METSLFCLLKDGCVFSKICCVVSITDNTFGLTFELLMQSFALCWAEHISEKRHSVSLSDQIVESCSISLVCLIYIFLVLTVIKKQRTKVEDPLVFWGVLKKKTC